MTSRGPGVRKIDEAPFLEDSANLESAVSLALSKGVVITTMAGQDNNGPDDLTYPAAIPGVIAAALAAWPAPLMAPGSASMSTATNDSVLVTVPSNTLDEYGPGDQEYQSYNLDASPAWIGGTAALIKSAYPHLAPALVARAIALSARDHPKGGYNVHLGFGLINPYGALVQAGKLAGLSMTAGVVPAGSAQVSSAAHFGSPPGIIQSAPRSTPKMAAFVGVSAVGVVLLLAALVLAARRPRKPVPMPPRRHAASS